MAETATDRPHGWVLQSREWDTDGHETRWVLAVYQQRDAAMAAAELRERERSDDLALLTPGLVGVPDWLWGTTWDGLELGELRVRSLDGERVTPGHALISECEVL